MRLVIAMVLMLGCVAGCGDKSKPKKCDGCDKCCLRMDCGCKDCKCSPKCLCAQPK